MSPSKKLATALSLFLAATSLAAPLEISQRGAPRPPYDPGTCSVHLFMDKYDNEADTGTPFWLLATIHDSKNHVIGTNDGNWNKWGAEAPLWLKSKLEDSMEVIPIRVGKSDSYYVQFHLGAQAWRSDDPSTHVGYVCDTSAWVDNGNNGLRREIFCNFVCDYSGGKRSDGGPGDYPQDVTPS